MAVTNITTFGAGGGGSSGSGCGVYTITNSGTGTGTFTVPHGTVASSAVLTSTGWTQPSIKMDGSMSVKDDIHITKNGKTLKVFDALELVLNRLGIIIADDEMLEKHPALKAAYEHYVSVFKDPAIDPKVKEAYDSYHTIMKLVRDEDG